MGFDNTIRKIDAKVKINFLSNKIDSDVSITETSRNDSVFADYLKNLIDFDFVSEDKKLGILIAESDLLNAENLHDVAWLVAENDLNNPRATYLLGEVDKVAWWGQERSKEDKSLSNTFLLIDLNIAGSVTGIKILGANGEYPEEYTLSFYAEDAVVPFETLVKNYDIENPEIEFKLFESVKRIKLQITKWSKPYAFAKLSHFSCSMIVDYTGNQIQSVEVLEEKTADEDKLSYGISSNSCDVRLLNKKQQYLDPKNYRMLRKNRSVEPSVICSGKEYSLGKFYSEEWKVESGKQFFSCKAYDALYGLKDFEIFYPMEYKDGVYKIDGVDTNGISLYDIIKKIFGIINSTMKEKRVYKSAYQYWVDQRLKDIKVPLALIETKSAWEIFQDIANVGLCHVYCDRDGAICFQRDSFDGENYNPITYVRHKEDGGEERYVIDRNNAEEICINPSNSFSYNLPSINRMVINRVIVEYWELEEAKENKEIEVDIKDCEVTTANGVSILKFKVPLKNMYLSIKRIADESNQIRNIKAEVYFDKLLIEANTDIPIANFKKIKMRVNYEDTDKGEAQVKYEIRKEVAESIRIYGVQAYIHASNKLVSKDIAEHIADKILNKYKGGSSYINTEWKGNAKLEPGEIFVSNDLRTVTTIDYECLSNEISFDGGYSQKTKARQI